MRIYGLIIRSPKVSPMDTTVPVTVIGRVHSRSVHTNLIPRIPFTVMGLVDIDFAGLFPDIHKHLGMRYVLHLCRIRDSIPSQTRLIEYEGIELVESLADYDDQEIDKMADHNLKRTPVATCIQFGMARTKTIKAITHWVCKKNREGAECDLRELTPGVITELVAKINAMNKKEKGDSKLYYPDAFVANDYKNWIKKVMNYLDSRMGKAGRHPLKLASTVTTTGRVITSSRIS